MSQKKSAFTRHAQFGFEPLEARSLLSGFHASPATQGKSDDHHGAAIVTGGAASLATPAISAKLAGTVQQSQSSDVHLTAALADPTGASQVTGTVRYESETEHGVIVSSFKATVSGATPGATIDVSIVDSAGNSVTVGQITAAADGTGKLSFVSNPKGSQAGFPANFPAVDAKSTVNLSTTDAAGVTATLASGALAVPTGHGDDDGESEDDSGDASETHLSAALADPSSTLTGSAKYESETEHGVVVSEFTVSVKGAKAGTLIDVSIADASGKGVSVGVITVGVNGSGKLSFATNPHDKSQQAFPANFPTLAAGSVVTLSAIDPASGALTPITSAALTSGKKAR